MSLFMWACNRHAGQLSDTIPHLIRHTEDAHSIASTTEALWDRIQNDDRARQLCNRDLADHMDNILTDRLEAAWGADT